jgi:hypothetical protein
MEKYPDFFYLITTELKKANVRYLLIGGFAITAYGYSRATRDFDILMTDSEFTKALPALKNMGYRLVSHVKVCAQFEHEKLDPEFIDLDVMLVDETTFEIMWKSAKETEIFGNKFLLPAVTHLIAMKLHKLNIRPAFAQRPAAFPNNIPIVWIPNCRWLE